MTDRILDRFAPRTNTNGAGGPPDADESEAEDLGAFGFLRGSKERATMLELRKKDGSILAIAYGYIDKAAFDLTEGITLHHAGNTIRITGRNLNREVHPKVRLFEAICRHRVPWVQELSDHQCLMAPNGAIAVTSIEW